MKRSELKEAIKSEIKSVLSENRYDINDPNSPMGKLSDEYESSGLKGIVDKYGLDVVLMMLSSGEYGDRLNESVLTEMSSSAIGTLLSQIEKEKDKPEKMKSIIKSLTGLIFRGRYDEIEVLRAVLNKFKDLNIKLNEGTGIFGTSIRDLDQYPEEIEVGDIVTLTTGGDELEVIDSREMFGSDMVAYRVKFPDGNTEEYSADQLRLAEGNLKEGKKGVVVDPDEIMMHINQYQSGNIDGDDLAQAIEEILVAMMNKSVTFSDVREAYLNENEGQKTMTEFIKVVEKAPNSEEIFEKFEAFMNSFMPGAIKENEDEAPAGDKKTEKAARGADKAKNDYAKLAGKDNTEISKASSLVKEKAKKAKEGDKEALNFLKSNQKVIKAYNDLKK